MNISLLQRCIYTRRILQANPLSSAVLIASQSSTPLTAVATLAKALPINSPQLSAVAVAPTWSERPPHSTLPSVRAQETPVVRRLAGRLLVLLLAVVPLLGTPRAGTTARQCHHQQEHRYCCCCSPLLAGRQYSPCPSRTHQQQQQPEQQQWRQAV